MIKGGKSGETSKRGRQGRKRWRVKVAEREREKERGRRERRVKGKKEQPRGKEIHAELRRGGGKGTGGKKVARRREREVRRVR